MTFIEKLLCLPPNASAHGPIIDHLLVALHWFMLVLFIGWSIFFLLCLTKFRKGKTPNANYYGVRSHFSTHVEIGVILVEVFLLIGFAIPMWTKRVNAFPDPKEATTVRAIGYQFGWFIHYPGKDGKFGKVASQFISAQNEAGLDPGDPAGQDDFFDRNQVHAPVNKPVIVQITSKDVIHNFAIREMRIAQDAIPGSEIPMWFTPVNTGEFNVICGQLCGMNHFAMQAKFFVDSAEEYTAFVDSKSPKKQ